MPYNEDPITCHGCCRERSNVPDGFICCEYFMDEELMPLGVPTVEGLLDSSDPGCVVCGATRYTVHGESVCACGPVEMAVAA